MMNPEPDIDLEELCSNCNHKRGFHHAKPTPKNPSICYGIACMCEEFK